MIDGSRSVPLSPPSSPRMSAYTATQPNAEWHSQPVKPTGGVCAPSETAGMGLLHNAVTATQFDIKDRPPLHTHKSYPYALNQVSHSSHQPTGALDQHGQPLGQRDRGSIGNTEASDSASLSVSYGASAPASPSSRLTPASPGSGIKHERDDDVNDQNLSGSAEEGDPDRPMTAQELRAHKRKMKRFRLTHNQTRFLMSEFARQAHPDAAHRERLAREIPGLSPRQVQVWFQNRRAKLKRLTSDDRERMMRSRALPDDFDMTQALHSPFGAAGHQSVGGTPMASPATYSPSFPEGNMVRPLTVDTFRRFPDGTQMPPGGINPPFGSFSFTPPQSATDTSSPVSATGDANAFPFSQAQAMDGTNPRRSNPFIGGTGPAASSFSSFSPMPRVPLDRMGRSRAESLCSPLRTSMSYSNDGSLSQSTAQSGANPDNAGIGDRQIPQTTMNGGSLPGVTSGNMPYGMGYSYNQMPGFESSRMRSMSSTLPRRIELSQHSAHYNASRTAPSNPQSATLSNYQTSPLGTPSSYSNPSMMSAPHSVSSFNNSPSFTEPNYNAPSASQSDPYAIGNVLGDRIADPQHAECKGSAGVQLPQQY